MENFGIYFYRTLHSRHGGKLSKLFNTPLWYVDTAVHCTHEKLPSRIQHLQWQRQSGGLKYFLPPAKYFLCAGSWSRSMNCARQPSGRPLYTRGRPWLRCLRPAADLATSARHNRGRAGHSNKFIFSTAAAVIISACNSPPSIIRYLMVTSRGDVGYNCNGYQSLLLFTHVNLLLCFIGPCADL